MQIVALCTALALLAVPSHEQGSQGSMLTSPCPRVFLYDPPPSNPGLWSGVIALTTDILLQSTSLNIRLDSHATRLVNGLGNVTTQEGLAFVIDNEEMQIHPCQRVLVPFFVQYDPLNTTPRLREIRLNGKVICKAETADCGLVADIGTRWFRPLIHNGLSYERGEIPWLVAIYRTTKESLSAICGGTLVSDRHVVTAAHCMYLRSETDIKDIVIKVGVHDLNDWSDDSTVTTTLIAADKHESYNAYTQENNIMVLTLEKRLKFTDFIRPACLWTGNTDLSQIVGSTGVVAGWGGDINRYNLAPLKEPQMVRVRIVSTKECRASKSIFHKLTSDKTLCAGSRNGDGPCQGDSGGGLYLKDGGKWRLRGVVSLAIADEEGICNLNEYVVYTDTAQYLPWIRSILTKDYFD